MCENGVYELGDIKNANKDVCLGKLLLCYIFSSILPIEKKQD